MIQTADRLTKTNKETGKLAKAYLLWGLGHYRKANTVINSISLRTEWKKKFEQGVGKYADAIRSLKACRNLLIDIKKFDGNKNKSFKEAIEVENKIAEIMEQSGEVEESVGRYLSALRMHKKLEKKHLSKSFF